MIPADRIDREILSLLQQNARRSNREIAAKVGVAESTCSTRIRRLETSGLITGYHARLHPQAAGIGLQAMVAVRLVRHQLEAIDAFWSHSFELSETVGVFHVTGQYDFLVHLAVLDANHLRDVTAKVITTWPEVSQIQTSVVFDHRRSVEIPMSENLQTNM